MRGQTVAVTLGVVGAVGLAAAAAWLLRREPASGTEPPAAVAAALPRDSTTPPDSVAQSGDSTTRVVVAESAAPADSVAPRPVHPPVLLGVWHHGDNRSKYGDSLSLALHENGTATSAERRYTLDRSGWHVSRVLREGSWAVRYRGNDRMDLCTSWSKPETIDVCERVSILPDTSGTDRPTMEFAGRHWRMEQSSGTTPRKAAAVDRPKARDPGTRE